jgi:hypothetical protein
MESIIINDYLFNRGRGVELRTSRITVNDLWPYLQQPDYSDAVMLEIWPISQAQLDALKEYIAANRDTVAEENARIDARIAKERAEQEANPAIQEMFARGRKSRIAMQAFLLARKANPSLFEEMEGEDSELRRTRWIAAYQNWRSTSYVEPSVEVSK